VAGSASSEEDIEMDTFDDDIKVISETRKTYEVDYKPLTHQQVQDLLAADIDYISTIFGVEVRSFSIHL
jgi:ariadne-1